MYQRPTNATDSIRPIATAFHVLAIGGTLLAGVFAIEASSMVFMGLDRTALLFLIGLVLALVWAISLMLEAVTVAKRPLLAFIAPLMVVVVAAICLSGVPRQIRVALSDRALTETVQALETAALTLPESFDEGDDPVLWAGAIPIYGVWDKPGGTHLIAGFTGSDSPAGLVRFADGPPIGRPPGTNALYVALHYQHVYGHWYRWSYH